MVMAKAGRTAMRSGMCGEWHAAPQERRPAGEAAPAVSVGWSIGFNRLCKGETMRRRRGERVARASGERGERW